MVRVLWGRMGAWVTMVVRVRTGGGQQNQRQQQQQQQLLQVGGGCY